MKHKISALLVIILVTPILAGIYGVLHDQLTYTISPEYYTKFKFYRFGLAEEGETYRYPERLGAALVGFLATWWTGIPIGIILGLTGLIHNFLAVGSMHNFSYAGGLFGMISGIIFSCLHKSKHKKTNNNIL